MPTGSLPQGNFKLKEAVTLALCLTAYDLSDKIIPIYIY